MKRIGVFVIGGIALFMTGSRGAILVFMYAVVLVYFYLRYKKKVESFTKKSGIFIYFFLIIASIAAPITIHAIPSQSFQERIELLKTATYISSSHQLYGVGMNNAIAQMYFYLPKQALFYLFQPVHNIYLLITTETGLIGFIFFSTLYLSSFFTSLKNKTMYFIPLSCLFLLGLFDHYLLTLQQGQLLFMLFLSLGFTSKIKRVTRVGEPQHFAGE